MLILPKKFKLTPPNHISPKLKKKIKNLSFQNYHPNKKNILIKNPIPNKK